jgi:hypothetical protein
LREIWNQEAAAHVWSRDSIRPSGEENRCRARARKPAITNWKALVAMTAGRINMAENVAVAMDGNEVFLWSMRVLVIVNMNFIL